MIPSQADLNNIIERFNFEKVRAYMVINKWTYKGETESPSIEELKRTAIFLLQRCYIETGDFSVNATGGFIATKTTFRGEVNYDLSFSIERKSCK